MEGQYRKEINMDNGLKYIGKGIGTAVVGGISYSLLLHDHHIWCALLFIICVGIVWGNDI